MSSTHPKQRWRRQQDSDFDGAWKEALRTHLRQFIEKFFSPLAELIDWSIEPEWLDKEINQIVGNSKRRNQVVDVLFKVRLRDGREQRIFCHLEIQTAFESEFELRIDRYNAGLKWISQDDVITIVVLADLSDHWRPQFRKFELAGFEHHLRFPICKLLDHLETDWLNDRSLPVQLARAQIAALRTASDPEARYHAKTQLVRNLYTVGYSADDIRELFRLIDWMMHLRIDLEQQFKADISALEKEQQMPYVTSIERLAIQEGMVIGATQERQRVVTRQLQKKLGRLTKSVQQQIAALSEEQSEQLVDSIFDISSQAELRAWLKEVTSASR